ncbi:MAG: HAMP domain-containing sensor histidine kinase [bacterium]|nr:HAMP domain-containing sensor histidine kinase [bacterium]
MRFKNILGGKQRASIESIQSDFVSLASHQLRTPLSAIKWYTEMLLAQRQGKLAEKQVQYLREIYRSNERAINLVNDLLDVSRIQEGQIHLELRSARVEDVIKEIMDNFGTLIKASQVSVDFEIVGGPLPKVEIDREKLKRVIVNLLSNSVKYTLAKGKIKITVEKNQHYIKISVKDSGIGIPKADQAKVFEKFFRSVNVIKHSPDGTGLGLFIARSLVNAMGGKIDFTSDEGRGTTFYVTLPLKQ